MAGQGVGSIGAGLKNKSLIASSSNQAEMDRGRDPDSGMLLASLSSLSVKDPSKRPEKMVEEIMQMSQVRKGAGIKNNSVNPIQSN